MNKQYDKDKLRRMILEEYSKVNATTTQLDLNEQYIWDKSWWTDEYGPWQKFQRGVDYIGQDIKRAFTWDSDTPKRFKKMKRDLARTVDPETWTGEGGIIDTIETEGIDKVKEALGDAYDTIVAILEAWSTWDGFINHETYGLRTVLYSVGGITAASVLSVIPYTKIIPGAAFAVLLADDIYHFVDSGPSWTYGFYMLFDLLGIFMGGRGSAGAKMVKATGQSGKLFAKNVINPLMQQAFKGATGHELQTAIMWMRNNIKHTKIMQTLFVESGLMNAMKNIATTITAGINSMGKVLIGWLSSLVEYPIIGEAALAVIEEIKGYMVTVKGFIKSVVDTFSIIMNAINIIIKYPNTALNKIFLRIFGPKTPTWLAPAILTGVTTYGLVKSIEWYAEFNASEFTPESAEQIEKEMAISLNEDTDELKKKHACFTATDDSPVAFYINATDKYETNPKIPENQLWYEAATPFIDFDANPNAIGAPCILIGYSTDPDKKYALISVYYEDLGKKQDPAIIWINKENVKLCKWPNDE